MTHIRSEIIGTGHYLPSKVVTNDDLAKIVDTSDEWIVERTGIKSRRIVAEGELTSDLCVNASKMALKNANLKAEDVDAVIIATITADNITPAVATKVAAELGVKTGVPAFDISAACSGFIYALTIADNMIKLNQAKRALVVGAESLSKITDWTDRNTCILFGDGAGAVVLQAKEGKGTNADTGLLTAKIYADGSGYEQLKTTGGVSLTESTGKLWMNGKEVFKYAIPAMAGSIEAVLGDVGASLDDVDWVIPHQANIRIIDGVAKKLNLDNSKVIITVDHQANTSAATIPLALSEAVEEGKIKKGDLIALTAMGAGFTWGGALVRY
ncbi:MAG: ketoacyl-ACP synthase III [Lactobacillaceae bacterium]|jgi:3-oxoacyl-[acyl-carrier-protein] synthase-3|nr:ketoacyl-ACP synthase III [Lactobacillaceae bacterium]